MGLSVGIVGLPNVGKSTLFNALLKKQLAFVANFPFATIEPNVGVVPVPDERLVKLAEVVEKEILRYKQSFSSNGDTKILSKNDQNSHSISVSQYHNIPLVPATVKFLDIAGLIAGASKGEGLGNKFLSHIRECDAICHVVRCFTDPNIIKSGSVNPKSDFETVETELKLADLQTLEKQKDPGNTPDQELKEKWDIIQKFKDAVSNATALRSTVAEEAEKIVAKELGLLTAKPILIVLNVDEQDLKNADELEKKYSVELGIKKEQAVAICAKTEMELAELSVEEQTAYLKELGVEKSGLERLIQKAFATLGLSTFLTAGEKEVRAWTIKKGFTAPQAAGVIHTDFEKGFIKASVVSYKDFINFAGWKKCLELGKVRQEGRDYIMQDGDVVEFKFNV